jgi:uncharacterized membrane protein
MVNERGADLMKMSLGKKGIGGLGGGVGGGGGPRKPISLLLGLAFLALGIVPLLNHFGVLEFEIPFIGETIIHVLSIIGAVFLLLDGMSEGMAFGGMQQQLKTATFIVAIVLLAVGLVPLLNTFGVIGFGLPAFVGSLVNVLFVLTGVLLLYGGTQGM